MLKKYNQHCHNYNTEKNKVQYSKFDIFPSDIKTQNYFNFVTR